MNALPLGFTKAVILALSVGNRDKNGSDTGSYQ
jgi:hypothetical protein